MILSLYVLVSGTGPVFTVNDIKSNQNYWGPGIILARRVMDIGNEWHILIADNLAETLIALKEEYKKTIKLDWKLSDKTWSRDKTLFTVFKRIRKF